MTEQLPILAILPQLCEALAARHEVILEAQPGAGKTTGVPLVLLQQAWLQEQTILLIQPRRLAAKSTAQRLASQCNEAVGATVGYRIRGESRVSDKTRIEVITEGVLLRRLQDDPALEGVGLVIFDEFHERHLNTDLALGLILEGRDLFRDDTDSPLKLLIMSATLDSEALASLLNDAPIIRSEGRTFPIDIHYRPRKAELRLSDQLAQLIREQLLNDDGSVLVFLPGQREILELQSLLQAMPEVSNHVDIYPLYGSLPLKAQQQAIQPSAQRKIVLSTDIAETSLTIEGITRVIDSGLCRQGFYDAGLEMTRLHTSPISKASARQRAGRAGRTSPGICFRLWSEEEQQRKPAQTTPEILRADLAEALLQLLNWGIDDPAELRWLDAPPKSATDRALSLLASIQAIEPNSATPQLTTHGNALVELPLHPRLAHMLIRSQDLGLQKTACQLAALLSDRDPLGQRAHSADIQDRIEWLSSSQPRAKELQKTASRLQAQLDNTTPPNTLSLTLPDQFALLIALAYPDRIAKTRSSGGQRYRLSNGRGALLREHDRLSRHEWLACAQLGSSNGQANDYVQIAAPLNIQLVESALAELVTEQPLVEWSLDSGRFEAQTLRTVGQLTLASQPLNEVDPELRIHALCELIKNRGLDFLQFNNQVQQLLARLRFAASQEANWPDFSEAALLEDIERWLAPYLTSVTRLNQLRELSFEQILLDRLSWPERQQLDVLAPERFDVPSGAQIKIDYSAQPPILAVKLQEMFSCTVTPQIGHGQALMLHLLSPAQRPLAVTQDLINFWHNVYPDVKKEMKGRYPKHPWPDDPLSAAPTGLTKARMQQKAT